MKKKNVKHYLNFAVTGAIGLLIGTGVMLASVLIPSTAPTHPDNTNFENVLEKKYFDNIPNFNLVFGEKTYSLGTSPAENLEEISKELYRAPENAELIFNPTGEEVFVFKEEKLGQEVDLGNLALYINDSLKSGSTENITIPTTTLQPSITKKDLEGLVVERSKFSTSIAGSEEGRRHNVIYALKAFNGLVVMPDEEVSFNQTTGERTFNSEYKDATIISGGKYVQGRGGGVCQASTTLYNALIRADIEILKVQNHSLPVKYVPLAFDAMVNDTTSDLVFKNTTGATLYFLTGCEGDTVWVKIFGAPMPEGLTIETRTETVQEIKKGDKIVPDTNGEYSKHITFKGEYYRAKYPQNGKECKGYLQYFQNGELVEEKLVRHVYYQGQDGIIMEGVEEPYEGIVLPENEVEILNY